MIYLSAPREFFVDVDSLLSLIAQREINDCDITEAKRLSGVAREIYNHPENCELTKKIMEARDKAEWFLGYAQDRDPDASVPWESSMG